MNEAECVGGVGGGGGGGGGDLNSNHHAALASVTAGTTTTTTTSTASCLSNASSQDIGDFVQDNSDYQWFLDYGYREGGIHHHASVLSSLTESYGGGVDEIGYYDALSKNLDANLAEADMESFRTEDIHALLTTLPAMCTDMHLVTDANREGEMFASVTGSMMAKFDFDSSVSPHSSSQGEESAASPDTMSICKSELLFSPVKDTPMPGANFSVDSLDCDLEHDIMLTCQANKDNYTIAFEGSVTMYSEESDDYHDQDKGDAKSDGHHWLCAATNHQHQNLIDTSMARSDSGLTTWSKLKKRSSEHQLRRHPSGNNNNHSASNGDNNTSTSGDETTAFGQLRDDNAAKSQSMPNLYRQRRRGQTPGVNWCGTVESPSPVQRRPHCVKVFDIQHQLSRSSAGSCYSDMAISIDGSAPIQDQTKSSSSTSNQPNHPNLQQQQQQQQPSQQTQNQPSNQPQSQQQQQPQNFSLVRLFMKQKSISAEGMSCGMDQSSTSECWPASQSESGDSFDLNNHKMEKHHSAPETSVFLDSLVDPSNVNVDNSQCHSQLVNQNSQLIGQRTHELIREELEESPSERSESVEQLTESASRDDSIYNSYEQDRTSPPCCHLHKFLVNKHLGEHSQKSDPGAFDRSLKQKCSSNNNNSSVEQVNEGVSARRRVRRGTQTAAKRYSSLSNESGAVSDTSSSTESAECTRMHSKPTTIVVATKHRGTQVPIHIMNRSMQTSRFGDGSYKFNRSGYGNDLIRIVEPSFLAKLKQQGESQKPVYIVYPNYTLPDLEFLKDKHEDITKVFLVPQKYSTSEDTDSKPHKTTPPVGNGGSTGRGRRPFSCNDMEMLKKKGFSHVRDWDSLTFLLPVECRQVLADVPEFRNVLKEKGEELLRMKEKPLFCVSPPMRPRGQRPVSCDCGALFDRNSSLKELKDLKERENVANVSSSSSTATQPSSGYRGSSTILSDSSNSPAPSNLNPLFVYRYDSVTSSEASLLAGEKQRSITTQAIPPVPRRSISLSDQKAPFAPPRPPLPKGILRKSLEGFKSRKNFTQPSSKRYSMFEMQTEPEDFSEEDNQIHCTPCNYKRKSLHEPYYINTRTFSEHSTETEDEGVEAGHGTDSSFDERFENLKLRPPTPPLPRNTDSSCHESLAQNPAGNYPAVNYSVVNYPSVNYSRGNDIINAATINCDELEQLEEYLKMSGISCSDNDDWDENELLRLRSHVSKFLALKINREHFDTFLGGKKTVSFAEKIVAHEDALKQYSTPPNSPNVSAMIHRHYQGKTLVDMPICEEGELSPDGYRSPQMENIPLSEKTSPVDLSQKMALITAVTHSVESLIHHFSSAHTPNELQTLGSATQTPDCARLVLNSLCPALYALLNDGLRPSTDTVFGPARNSVWRVVEASADQGELTRPLHELVMKINAEDVLTEGVMKFNAFVIGLLNVRSLDAWASYLRTRETVLRKHYTSDALLLRAHTGGVAVRSLIDSLIATLQPLALLPFQIDLLFEYRQLHRGLQRMEEYLQPPSPVSVKVSPMSHLTNKQLTLMKLVRSVQSNMSQSCDDTEDISIATMINRRSSEYLDIESIRDSPTDLKESNSIRHSSTILDQCADTASDPSLPDLLNSSAHTKTTFRDDKQRPRSCVDPNLAMTSGFKLVEDVTGTVKKRWSGIHLGSKFVQAFDKLADDTEEEYTDSLEHNASNRRRFEKNGAVPAEEDTGNSNEEGSSSPAQSLHEDGPESIDSQLSDDKPLNGGKFRRLQMKWEMLSGRDVAQSPTGSPNHSTTAENTPPHTTKSKIPRLVNSPVKSGIPVLSPSFLKTCQTKQQLQQQPLKKVTTPPGAVIAGRKQPMVAGKIGAVKKSSVFTRTSRVDQLETENRIHPVRPSSLPYRPVSSAKGSKLTPPRRAVSSSVTRKPQQHQTKPPKVVRTLSHRLPSDNGHLSFNEGEKLKVILEVDNKWLLCCRGDQKGLVPRSAVISVAP